MPIEYNIPFTILDKRNWFYLQKIQQRHAISTKKKNGTYLLGIFLRNMYDRLIITISQLNNFNIFFEW